ncbi:MAG: hypothetical protein PVH93_02455 [Nitrosopumilaceae archaeon]
MDKNKIVVIVALVIGISALTFSIAFIGQGNVRHVVIFWQEKVEQTVVFEEINGKVQLRGVIGVDGDPNPTLISRTGFAYLLTVINNGETQHRLYIEGLEVQTDLLNPGQQETIVIYPMEEGIYNYYDKREFLEKLGLVQIITVVPSDEFQGIWKDLI